MIGALLMLYAIYHCKRYGEDKEKIHAEVQMLHDKGLLKVLKESFFALLSPCLLYTSNSCKDFFFCHRTRNFSADLCRDV